MNAWKVILATMMIFGTGVITGGLLVKNTTRAGAFESRPVKGAAKTNQVSFLPAQIQRMDFLLRARNELNLTPQQHERIEKIIREGQEKSRKLWDGIAPEMRKELQSVNEKIRNELTPEQRRRFEQLLKNNRPNLNNPDNGPQPPDRVRDRLRQGNPGEFPPNDGPRPPRRGEPENPPRQENSEPAPR